MYVCIYTGTIIEGPQNVTYLPGQTPIPLAVVLTCSVTEGALLWRVNGTDYTIEDISSGELQGHSNDGTNLVIVNPMNNTQYICVSVTDGNGDTLSDPAYIIIPGKCMYS